MERAIDLTTTVVRGQDQVSGTLDAEAVMLSIENGKYYSMSPMGAHIWARLDTPVQVRRLIEELLAQFEVERGVCEQEVLSFLTRLYAEHLLSIEG